MKSATESCGDDVKAFDLDRNVVADCEGFSRSFTRIRAVDLKQAIDRRYADGHFWPDALLSINPHYERGPTADSLAADGAIDALTAQVFRADGTPLQFYRHQGQAEAPNVGFHALRHTHASLLVAAGVDIVEISKRLGHADPSITLKVYAHLFRTDDAKSAAAIDTTLARLGKA